MSQEPEISVSWDDFDEYKQEIEVWFRHLNSAVGIALYTLSLACLGTKHPRTFAVISIVLVFTTLYEYKKFPPKIKQLRELAKTDRRAKEFSEIIDSRFFSAGQIIKKGLAFWVGLLFTSYVIFSAQVDALLGIFFNK